MDMDMLNDIVTSAPSDGQIPSEVQFEQNQADPFSSPIDFQTSNEGESKPQGDFENNNMMMMDNFGSPSDQIDEEEAKRIAAREEEERERRQKIEEKINFELKKKEETRNEACEYMKKYELERQEKISKKKELNKANEADFLNNKSLIKEGKKNAWEIVTDNICIRESDYKGSNDVSRMRNVILARKNDQCSNNNSDKLNNLI